MFCLLFAKGRGRGRLRGHIFIWDSRLCAQSCTTNLDALIKCKLAQLFYEL